MTTKNNSYLAQKKASKLYFLFWVRNEQNVPPKVSKIKRNYLYQIFKQPETSGQEFKFTTAPNTPLCLSPSPPLSFLQTKHFCAGTKYEKVFGYFVRALRATRNWSLGLIGRFIFVHFVAAQFIGPPSLSPPPRNSQTSVHDATLNPLFLLLDLNKE